MGGGTSLSAAFDQDHFPGAPRILFIGEVTSPHARSWINLLDGAGFNIRFFSLPSADTGLPSPDIELKVYVSEPSFETQSETRLPFTSVGDRAAERELRAAETDRREPGFWRQISAAVTGGKSSRRAQPGARSARAWLAAIVREWRPDIVHTFGIYPAGVFFFATRHEFGVNSVGHWVLQTRGGSDLQLRRFDPELVKEIRTVANDATAIVTDNFANLRYLEEMGIDTTLVSSISPVPGTGGIDVDGLAQGTVPPSRRHLILWPKAYEVQWSKALPVLEALRLVWHRLPPCRIIMLAAVQQEVRLWLRTLPMEIQAACDVHNFILRSETLEMMRQARLMLAPSLVDGRPNSMLEAMAAGAVPLVSPIDSIREVATERQNVLFAQNLDINGIAEALVTGMRDDPLVDTMARNNLTVVRQIADRARIRPRVVELYRSLAAQGVR